MRATVEAGQLWINARIRELAAGREPLVQSFEWEDPATRSRTAIAGRTIGLAIWIGEKHVAIRFLESELKDVEDDIDVQSILMNRLREALR